MTRPLGPAYPLLSGLGLGLTPHSFLTNCQRAESSFSLSLSFSPLQFFFLHSVLPSSFCFPEPKEALFLLASNLQPGSGRAVAWLGGKSVGGGGGGGGSSGGGVGGGRGQAVAASVMASALSPSPTHSPAVWLCESYLLSGAPVEISPSKYFPWQRAVF